jgi:UDP-glucuronate decarboxylase
MDYRREHGLEVRIVRIFNTYGPKMALDDGRVVSNFVAQALQNEPLTIFGDGKQTRSFQYIDDLIKGMVAVMDNEEHVGPFNVGNPGEFTMIELAEMVKKVVNPKVEISFVANTEDDPSRRKPDITKAKTLLGWEPKVKLEDGLRMMVKDFSKRLHLEEGETTPKK